MPHLNKQQFLNRILSISLLRCCCYLDRKVTNSKCLQSHHKWFWRVWFNIPKPFGYAIYQGETIIYFYTEFGLYYEVHKTCWITWGLTVTASELKLNINTTIETSSSKLTLNGNSKEIKNGLTTVKVAGAEIPKPFCWENEKASATHEVMVSGTVASIDSRPLEL